MKKSIILLIMFPLSFFAQKNIELEPSIDLIQKGLENHDKKEYFEAIQKYKKVSVNDTNYHTAQFEMALSYLAQEEYILAQRVLKNLIKSEIPFDSKALVYKMLGQTYEGDNKFEEAIKIYDEGIKLYPMNHNLYFSKGITLEKFEKHQEALECYKKAVKTNMNHANSHLRLGVLAAREGHFAESYFSLMAFILLEPNTDRSQSAVAFLEEMANGTYTPEPKNVVLSQSGDDFENINLFFKNQVALQANYKAKFSYETDFAKQFHLILSNIKFDENDAGFWTQMYVPLYLDIFNQKQLDNLVLFSLQSLNNAKIQKKIKSKKSAILDFHSKAANLWVQYTRKQKLEFEGKVQDVYVVYSDEGAIIGRLNDKEKLVGKRYFYHPEGNLKLIGEYDDEGNRTGMWQWKDYFTQKVVEESFFKAGKLNGTSKFYYESGELRETRTYKDDIVQDTVYLYYRGGEIQEKIAVKEGMRNGLNVIYYENGSIKSKANYIDNKANGKFQSYFTNGQLEVEFDLVNDYISGLRKLYYPNGKLNSEYIYNEKGPNGKFSEWYPNGQLKEKGEMKDGNYLGEILEYYSNGLPFSKGKYDESGKENGTLEYFDSYGKKYQEFIYKKGVLEQIKTFNEKEELVKTIDRSGKKINYITLYAETRTVKAEGVIDNEQRSGIWKYYDNYGNLESTESYDKGKIVDTAISYFPNGKINYKYTYENSMKNGLYLEYNKFGELIMEGMYKDDERSNDWYQYYNDGSLKQEYSYKAGKLHGYQKNYAVNGKLYQYDILDNGRIIASVYLDTNGNEIQRFGELNGLIKIKDALNQYDRFVAEYKNGEINGTTAWYSLDNKLLIKGKNVNGYREGLWTWYHENGKVLKTIEYVNGQISGKFQEFHENGTLSSESNYVGGLTQGQINFYFDNGKINFKATYVDDLRDGKVMSYSSTGELQQIRNYNRGVLISYSYLDKTGKEVEPVKISKDNFTFTTYYQNGEKALTQTRVFGELHGKYLKYGPNGKVLEDENYIDGDRVGVCLEYYENGNKKVEGNYKWGEKHGLETTYYPNGKVKSTQYFLFDKAHGEMKEYNAEGKLILTTLYFNDEAIKSIKH